MHIVTCTYVLGGHMHGCGQPDSACGIDARLSLLCSKFAYYACFYALTR